MGLGGPRVKRCGVGQGGPIKPPAGPALLDLGHGAFTGSNPLEAKSFCLQLPFTGTVSQCEAGVSLELSLLPQSEYSEQPCVHPGPGLGRHDCHTVFTASASGKSQAPGRLPVYSELVL